MNILMNAIIQRTKKNSESVETMIYNKYLDVWNRCCYNIWYRFDSHIKWVFHRLKESYQRIRYGYSFYDCYSIDTWFSNIMPSMLIHLAENTHGYPFFQLHKETLVNCHCRSFTAPDEDGDYGKWKMILNEMACCIENANIEFEDSEFYSEDDPLSKREEFIKWRKEQLHKGLELFEEYFHDLWD